MSEMEEIVKEFLVESHENLDQLDRDLVSLEQDPTDRDVLASIFRTIHTIKGTCGFLGFGKLESVAHVGENLLSKLRDGVLLVDPPITSSLLSLTDAVREMLNSIETTGVEGNVDYSELVDVLVKLAQSAPGAAPAAPETGNEDEGGPELLGDILVKSGKVSAGEVALATEAQLSGDPRRIGEILIDKGVAKPQEIKEALVQQSESRSALSECNVRVDVSLLDKLMNLVGELVLARNQVLQFTATQENMNFQATSQRLNLITTELQAGVMKTRMQPIGNIWSKFPRVVRDLSLACGKNVRLEMQGKETELDRTIIEAIKDPLTHIVRNSVDHGIECYEKREAAGKTPEGTLLLRAFHEGGQVIIEISDDGGGINTERVKQKAHERGLISADQIARMSEREILNLIFLPGFSTAEKISNVSGRGVGMDVVRTNIEKIGGTVDIQSQFGQGTTLRIKIPLTLAIIPALIVASGDDRYAIPQVNLVELVRLEGDQAVSGIESIHGAPVYRLRGRLLPLIYLNKALGLDQREMKGESPAINIVVVHADDRQFGLIVDDIHDTEEIVVKPLSKQLKSVSVFAGATIMGDGKVALILDVMGLAQQGHAVGEARGRAMKAAEHDAAADEQKQTLLLFSLGESRRLAIPLSAVARLEEFPHDIIEHSGDQEVVQYRGQIMPLLRLSKILGAAPSAERPDVPLQVIVYSENKRSVGLVVDHILDIVEQVLTVQRRGGGLGLTGTAVVGERVTQLLDIQAIIRESEPTFFETAEAV